MVKRFSKFFKFKNKTNNNYASNKRQSRKQERSGTPTCYECGKIGHIKHILACWLKSSQL